MSDRVELNIPSKFEGLLRPARYKVYYGGRGSGKAIDRNEIVPTPSGWTRLADLKTGDQVFDEQGVPASILAIYEVNPDVSYRLTFSDGAMIDCCADHLWVTWTHAERKSLLRSPYDLHNKFPKDWTNWTRIGSPIASGPKVRTTEEIVKTLTHGTRKDTNHCIPVATPIQCPVANLPIEPYVLGYWLANGNSLRGTVTPGSYEDDFDSDFIQKMFAESGYFTTIYSDGALASKRLTSELRNTNLVKDKHVPKIYFRASIPQRLALLRGLMDGDGTTDKGRNTVSFSSTRIELAAAVFDLAASLGQKPTFHEGRATLNGKDCGPHFRINWRPIVDVFCLPRKLKRSNEDVSQELRSQHRMIVKAERIENKPMRCLTVDSPNQMFLVGRSYIPTHNTESIAQVLVFLATRQSLLILCCRVFQNSIEQSLYRVIVYWIYQLNVQHLFDIQKRTIICKTTGAQFIFRGLQNQIAEIRSMKGVNIFWVDEAHSVTMDAWLYIDPTIRENNSEVWISYNPEKIDDPTHVRFVLNPQPDSIIEKVNWSDNPFFPPMLEQLRRTMLRDDLDNYGWIWEGETRQITEASVFNRKLSVQDFPEPPEKTVFYHGLDFGFSVDPTAMIRCWIKPSDDGIGEDLMIDREAYATHIELDEMPAFFDRSIETARIWPIYADSARPECISYLSNQGFNISPAEKWAGSIEDGIAHIRAFRKVIVHATRCPNTVRDFRLYSYKVDLRSVDLQGKPQVLPILVDKHNHSVDSARYALSSMIQHRGGLGVWRKLLGR